MPRKCFRDIIVMSAARPNLQHDVWPIFGQNHKNGDFGDFWSVLPDQANQFPHLRTDQSYSFNFQKMPGKCFRDILWCPPRPNLQHECLTHFWPKSQKWGFWWFLVGFAWPGKSVPHLRTDPSYSFNFQKCPESVFAIYCDVPHTQICSTMFDPFLAKITKNGDFGDFWSVLPDQANQFPHLRTDPSYSFNFQKCPESVFAI